MALRAGYKGFKKLISPLILNRPGTIEIDSDALNAELNEVFFPRSEQAELGAKNLNGTKYSSGTSHLVVFTVNADGTVTANGTASGGDAELGNTGTEAFTAPFDAQVILSGGVSTNAHIYPYDRTDNARPYTDSSKTTRATGQNATGTKNVSFWMEKGHVYTMALRVTNGTAVENIVFKPMLRLASDPDVTFVPYAETNAELTSDVTTLEGSADDQKTAINAIIAAATGAADFAAFKTAMGAITPVTRSAAPQATREVIEEESVTTKKTTRKKSTATADEEKEGDK